VRRNRSLSSLLLAVAVGLLPAASGCYSFSTSLPGHIETVMVPVMENETLRPEVSEDLVTALTGRFVRDNQLQVVQRNADAVLEGTVTGYEDRVFGFNANQQAEEYVVVVTVRLTFRDRVKNRELWSEEAIRGVGNYFVGSSDPNQASTAAEALVVALQQIVDITMARTFEGW
jgi:hypothetical protein